MGSTYYPGDGHITYEHEYIVLLRKPGKRITPSDNNIRVASRLKKDQRSLWFRGIWEGIYPERQNTHIAMFPITIPDRLIRMYTYVGETVLDPFLGSGTTICAASMAGRNSIGYEINKDFVEIIYNKFKKHCPYSTLDIFDI